MYIDMKEWMNGEYVVILSRRAVHGIDILSSQRAEKHTERQLQ